MNDFNATTSVEQAVKPIRTFSFSEILFAWLCLAAGYAFCRVFPAVTAPFGAFLFIFALYIVSAIIVKIRRGSLKGMTLSAGISALLIGCSILFNANGFLIFFAYLYALATYSYFIYTAFGNATEAGFSDLLFLDFFKASLIAPFQSFGQLFKAIFSNKSNSGGRIILKCLAGIALALVPTVIIVILLSYDSGFTTLLSRIFDFAFEDIFFHFGSFVLGIPIGMFLYGIFISSVEHKCKEVITAEMHRKTMQKMHFAPALTVLFAVLPILTVYVLFFISQWKYYVSGFAGELPTSMSYAEYAREGFFQLCAVSVINFMIIALIGLFMRRKSNIPSPVQRIISIILSLFTLILIATAVAKMVLYIDVYGLTPKRVYATWFMAVLALLFLLVILKQIFLRLKTIALSTIVVVCCFAALSFSNIEGIIANYNVDRYLNGTLEQIDADALSSLGDAALPAMLRFATTQDQKYGTSFLDYESSCGKMSVAQYHQYSEVCHRIISMTVPRNTSFWSFSIPQLKADAAIKESGLGDWLKR